MKIQGLALLSDEYLEERQKWWKRTELACSGYWNLALGLAIGMADWWPVYIGVASVIFEMYAFDRAAAYQAEIDARLDAWAVPYDKLEFCARMVKKADAMGWEPWDLRHKLERFELLLAAARALPDEDE